MTAEVRGRANKWRVFYQDPAGIASQVPVYGQDGVLKEVISCGAPSGKLIESAFEGTSQDEAVEYARWLGATEVAVKKTATKQEALAKARAARQKGAA
jgi:hypothetical protein